MSVLKMLEQVAKVAEYVTIGIMGQDEEAYALTVSGSSESPPFNYFLAKDGYDGDLITRRTAQRRTQYLDRLEGVRDDPR